MTVVQFATGVFMQECKTLVVVVFETLVVKSVAGNKRVACTKPATAVVI